MPLAFRNELTADRLRELLHYDPETGLFTWAMSNSSRIIVGQPAGYMKSGYIAIRVDGVKYWAHRLAWLYMHGDWPMEIVDHINRVKSDNRFINLRDASHHLNMINKGAPLAPVPRKPARAPAKRCRPRRGRWEAYATIAGRSKYVGYFDSESEAVAASKAAEKGLRHDGAERNLVHRADEP